MNPRRRVRGPGLHTVGPVPTPGGSCRAPSALRPCIGTMNRWPSRAGRKAPINRTHSKRFALADESTDHAVAFGVRASSAPLSQGRLQFDGRAGSWRAPTTVMSCIGTMNPPLTPPRRGMDRSRTNACSPPGRGRGWVGSWRAPTGRAGLLISSSQKRSLHQTAVSSFI